MRLFKPKAPSTSSAGISYNFNFAADARNPDGSYRTTPSAPELSAAVSRVAQEIARLRAVKATGNSCRKASALPPAIDKARAALDSAAKTLERKRAQGQAGMIEIADVKAAQAEYSERHAALRVLLDESRQRENADRAAADLARLLAALQ